MNGKGSGRDSGAQALREPERSQSGAKGQAGLQGGLDFGRDIVVQS